SATTAFGRPTRRWAPPAAATARCWAWAASTTRSWRAATSAWARGSFWPPTTTPSCSTRRRSAPCSCGGYHLRALKRLRRSEPRPERVIPDRRVAVDGDGPARRELGQLGLQNLHAVAVQRLAHPRRQGEVERHAVALDLLQRPLAHLGQDGALG